MSPRRPPAPDTEPEPALSPTDPTAEWLRPRFSDRCLHASIRDQLCSPAKSGTKTGTNGTLVKWNQWSAREKHSNEINWLWHIRPEGMEARSPRRGGGVGATADFDWYCL
jgi:hypothetical protein